MSHLKEHWFPYLLGIIISIVILKGVLSGTKDNQNGFMISPSVLSIVPDTSELSNSEADKLILYGKNLIDSTARYFGPHGKIAAITNGLNCESCHRESGTKLYTNNFLAVASTYPKFRERSGRIESIEFRVNDCMQRSLNGNTIDSLSKEMRAMVAYIKWTGKNVHKNEKQEGVGNKEISFLDKAADPVTGKTIYQAKCRSCHGENGQGLLSFDSAMYIYPPLWGSHSYVVSAGMYRLSKLAAFIKSNMPFGATFTEPQLNDNEAWDVAAFINSQPHPQKTFAYDWPVISTKPVDYPFGPYSDGFSQRQHKFGPFLPIKKAKENTAKLHAVNYPAKQ